ncbi:hypothetical protein HZS_1309 [Henneguya salminicola]|nr:hypothetical protein HZS_1309 [Henneguya salminicola]
MEDLPKQNLRKRFYTSSHNEGSPSVDESTNKAHKNILEYYVDKYLQNMSHRFYPCYTSSFKTFFVRLILTAILLILLPLLVFGDFLINFSIILIIVIQCYREYVRVGYTEYRIHKLPLIRSLAYYILFTTIYLLLGEFPITYLVSVLPTNTYIFLITYHKFINFCLFMLGTIALLHLS